MKSHLVVETGLAHAVAVPNGRTTRFPSSVATPVTTSYAAKASVFVNLRNTGNLKSHLVVESGLARAVALHLDVPPHVRQLEEGKPRLGVAVGGSGVSVWGFRFRSQGPEVRATACAPRRITRRIIKLRAVPIGTVLDLRTTTWRSTLMSPPTFDSPRRATRAWEMGFSVQKSY